ncbi:MAG TPA: hypothetical protein VIZ17_16000, partial [Acetobacteraceae bacterium]
MLASGLVAGIGPTIQRWPASSLSGRVSALDDGPRCINTALHKSKPTWPCAGKSRRGPHLPSPAKENASMSRVIDLECNLPAGEEYPEYHDMLQGRPGNPVADRLERPEGYGFDNYKHIFRNRTAQYVPQPESVPGERMEKFIADMDRAGVECGVVGASNETLKRVCGAYPDRFVGLAAISPLDGMR